MVLQKQLATSTEGLRAHSSSWAVAVLGMPWSHCLHGGCSICQSAYMSTASDILSSNWCREANKEAGLADKKLQRLEASRDAELASLREQLNGAVTGASSSLYSDTPQDSQALHTALLGDKKLQRLEASRDA